MNKLLIFGASDFARMVSYYFEKQKKYKVEAFVVEKQYKINDEFCGKKIITIDEMKENYPSEEYKVFVAIGYSLMNSIREEKYLMLKDMGYKFATYISEDALIEEDLIIGENCFIEKGVIIHPFVKIKSNTIIIAGTLIGHDTEIGENVFISGNATIAGNIKIEKNCYIGAGSTLKNGIKISEKSLIGGGVTLLKDTKEKDVYYSNKPGVIENCSDKIYTF